MPSPTLQTWPTAWEAAATGPGGFWVARTVADEFSTPPGFSADVGARVLQLLAERPAIRRVIEIGAGDGLLVDQLSRARPDLRCVGIDVRPRPDRAAGRALNEPAGRVDWLVDTWSVRRSGWTTGRLQDELDRAEPTMIIAVEWLDELPAPQLLGSGAELREMVVDRFGEEQPGPLTDPGDRAWVDHWWPRGSRRESGRFRDQAWAELVGSLAPAGGCALMIDYGHHRTERPSSPAIRGYAAGRRRPAVPDGTVNLTSDVAVDAVARAGVQAGATTVLLRPQSEVLGSDPSHPVADHGRPTDTHDILRSLGGRTRAVAQRSSRGFGDHWWLLQEVPAR